MTDLSLTLPEPPALPPGLQPGAPDFVGIGAQKAATSYWLRLIQQHPRVHAPKHFKSQLTPRYLAKERHFFDRFFDREITDADRLQFGHWFPRPAGSLAGEWTPRYGIEHWAPRLLRRLAPRTRLLMILRNPVDRFVSGMNHRLRKHTLTANDAHVSFLRGLYAWQLDQWLTQFPRDRILVLQYERCTRDPLPHLLRSYEFLGLEAFEPDAEVLARPRNVTRNAAYSLTSDHRRSLVEAYRNDVQRLRSMVPDLDIGLWPEFCG